MKICITGGPRTGKTSYVALHPELVPDGCPVFHTDDQACTSPTWSGAAEIVALWMLRPGPWVIEGVTVAAALRKFLASSSAAPCDRVIVLRGAFSELSPSQAALGREVDEVMAAITQELRARGVRVDVEVAMMSNGSARWRDAPPDLGSEKILAKPEEHE
jgi:hypothetical protein